LRVAIIVADQGIGVFQRSLASFMEKLLRHAEFALISVIVQPETVVDYSSDAGALSAGLRRLGTRQRQRGAQLMEAIEEVTKDVRGETKEVRSENKRPVIVVMRMGGEATTQLTADDVREQLRKSGAILYVVSTVGANRPVQGQAAGTDAASVQRAQLSNDEVTSSALNLAQVLGDGAKESGGRHDEIVSTTLVPAVDQLANELLHQYAITFTLAEGVKPNEKISVTSKRKGVTVRAPARLPN
jgi:hypothetical protein